VDIDSHGQHRYTKTMQSEWRHKGMSDAAVLIEALSELNCPAYTSELSHYLRARYGKSSRALTPTRIERVVGNNILVHREGGMPSINPSLCTALTSEYGEAIMRLISRTDWPLARRVVAATTGRARHLLMTARLCDLALNKKGYFADHPTLLRLTATHARGLPDTVVRYERYDLEEWLGLSLELSREADGEDERARVDAAARLAITPGFHPIFGMRDEYLEVRDV
jgi:hypothetical protein